MAGNKKSSGVAVLIAALALIALSVWMLFARVYTVRSVVLQGDTKKSVQEIAEIAGIHTGSSIFAFDPDKAWRRLEETGILEVADVHTKLPGTVYITVNDRVESALVLIGGRIAVIDDEGYVTRVENEEPLKPSVFIIGTGATQAEKGAPLNAKSDRMSVVKDVLAALRAIGASDRFREIDVSDPTSIRLSTYTGIGVRLGDSSNAEQKLLWAVAALRDLDARGSIHGTLDVSSGTKADYTPSR